MKRTFALLLSFLMVFALTACGDKNDSSDNSDGNAAAAGTIKIKLATIGPETGTVAVSYTPLTLPTTERV